MTQDAGGRSGSVTRDDELGANEFLALRRSGAFQCLKQTSNSGHATWRMCWQSAHARYSDTTRIGHMRLTWRPLLIGDVGSIQLICHGRIVGYLDTGPGNKLRRN